MHKERTDSLNLKAVLNDFVVSQSTALVSLQSIERFCFNNVVVNRWGTLSDYVERGHYHTMVRVLANKVFLVHINK